MADTYQEIEQVVIDTFSMWDVVRVGFSWRKYYLEHTLQVQNLSLRMAQDLGADPEQLRIAAILHDITKRYDGAIVKTEEGKNVVDEEGFWLNETVRPDRHNWVSELYDKKELGGLIHHVSGAVLTELVLDEFGLPHNFIKPVAKVVRGHLKGKVPPDVFDERYKETEVRILYDADTMDPNVGLTAFYRNIQIVAGNQLKKGEPLDLAAYIRNLPRWVEMKDAFREQLLTERGKEICDERQARSRQVVGDLNAELEREDVNRKYGMLGAVEYLFTNPEDPSIREHLAGLKDEWLPERERLVSSEDGSDRDHALEALERSRNFIRLFEGEIAATL